MQDSQSFSILAPYIMSCSPVSFQCISLCVSPFDLGTGISMAWFGLEHFGAGVLLGHHAGDNLGRAWCHLVSLCFVSKAPLLFTCLHLPYGISSLERWMDMQECLYLYATPEEEENYRILSMNHNAKCFPLLFSFPSLNNPRNQILHHPHLTDGRLGF